MNIRPGIAAALLSAAAAITQTQAPAPVTGVVFEDGNRNGQRDAGERGLGGVAVSNQREVVQTASDGSYSLARAADAIVFISLPDGYAAVGNFWRSVSASSNSPVDFALTAAHLPGRSLSSTRPTRTSARKPSATSSSCGRSLKNTVRISCW